MISISIRKSLHGADGPIDLAIDTSIQKGEIVTLYGPTGSGKSSVLRMIAGLMTPDAGAISVADRIWFDHTKKINLPSQQRRLGMVFQEYSLFPNMTVRGNLEFALDDNRDATIVDRLLEVSGLTNLQDKKPNLLSGGQKQRVALARALVRKPSLLLLDEPLSALDADMRATLQTFIVQFHQEFNLTTILVSHDLGEVIKMSNRVLVIESGKIKTDCEPRDLLK